MKQYFEAANMAEYGCLIIPAVGYFSTGELMSGFGIGGLQYVEDGIVKYGLSQDAFYYMFFLPNVALTYGGAAGVWYGIK
ncbi:MAG: hypothetical protein K2G28_02910, partial [Acetatifactor sp.]|nr:hypothetical protein [Acetatifactor sp.]